MGELALYGGAPEVKGVLKPFNTIGRYERFNAEYAILDGPLSGFLGGQMRGGPWVCALEEQWAAKVGAKHGIACNSATSGLLAACAACGVSQGSLVTVPALTMSATAAAPRLLGASIYFGDVDEDAFCLAECGIMPEVIIVTDLFGQSGLPIDAGQGPYVIVDASQAPLVRDHVGGDIDVYSFNVHKHIQCGEGGICVTDDDELAEKLRMFINHGEMAGGPVGLNLRMTEVTAAIALAQLRRADDLITLRVAVADVLTTAVRGLPGILPPLADRRHVYYIWAAKYYGVRKWFVDAMNAEGVPLRAGYVDPLYRLPAFAPWRRPCEIAERLQDHELVIWENCAWDPSAEQLIQIDNAFAKVLEYADQRT